MQLKNWRIDKGLTQTQVSKMLSDMGCEVTQSQVCRWEKSVFYPSLKKLRTINDMTDGDVTPNDWLI